MNNFNEATPVMRRSFVLLCLSLLLVAPGVIAQPLPKAPAPRNGAGPTV